MGCVCGGADCVVVVEYPRSSTPVVRAVLDHHHSTTTRPPPRAAAGPHHHPACARSDTGPRIRPCSPRTALVACQIMRTHRFVLEVEYPTSSTPPPPGPTRQPPPAPPHRNQQRDSANRQKATYAAVAGSAPTMTPTVAKVEYRRSSTPPYSYGLDLHYSTNCQTTTTTTPHDPPRPRRSVIAPPGRSWIGRQVRTSCAHARVGSTAPGGLLLALRRLLPRSEFPTRWAWA